MPESWGASQGREWVERVLILWLSQNRWQAHLCAVQNKPRQHGKVYLKGFYSEIIIDSWEVENLVHPSPSSLSVTPYITGLQNQNQEPELLQCYQLGTDLIQISQAFICTCVCVWFCAIIFYVLICVTTTTIKAENHSIPTNRPSSTAPLLLYSPLSPALSGNHQPRLNFCDFIILRMIK